MSGALYTSLPGKFWCNGMASTLQPGELRFEVGNGSLQIREDYIHLTLSRLLHCRGLVHFELPFLLVLLMLTSLS